ncbi:MAG: hypothetical protein EBZ49_10075 [Proteobacteria bacterium]|nr:hypothetical protein [Pseudomonadota bacterium]
MISVAHPKFFFFDTGVFGAIRPRGPLDSDTEILGTALESSDYPELKSKKIFFNFPQKVAAVWISFLLWF